MEKHVFISYRHEDNDFAEALIHRVERAGFTTWVDNDQLHAGDDWRASIDQAIKSAFALIVIMSPGAKQSEYVTYEWAFAWGAGIKVIPVLYQETPLHPRLEVLHYLNFTNHAVRPWDRLITVLKQAEQAARPASASSRSNVQETLPIGVSTPEKIKPSWVETGDLLMERKEYQEALDAYKQAIFQNPHDAAAYSGESWALAELKQYKGALAASEQALRFDPNNTFAWNNKGNALHGLRRYEEALAAFEQAIRLNPKSTLFWKNKSIALENLKRYEEALAAFEQAIHLDPDYAITWNNKGSALADLKQYEEALAAYEQAIRLDPDYATAWNNKGDVLKALRRSKEAEQAYAKARELGYGG